jgi:MoaA/NifB/PqqE/SkfB family radical SAM enzyme
MFKWRLLGDRSPIVAAIKITQRCNLRCKHCTWKNRITKDLSLSEWKDIIDDLHRQGVTTIAIEGGEPTLHNDVSRIVDYINSKNMYSIFVTNGTQDISFIDPDVFWVSIDGMKNTHDKIRGNGVFLKMISILKKNRDKKMISLTTISKTNAEDLEPMCKFFSQADFLYGSWFHFAYPYSDIEITTLNAKERIKIAQKIIELKKKYPKIMNSTSYLETVGRQKKCYPWLLVNITDDGKQQHGCMVKYIEKENCSKCDMGCYGELSRTYEFKRDTAKFWSENFGLPKLLEK